MYSIDDYMRKWWQRNKNLSTSGEIFINEVLHDPQTLFRVLLSRTNFRHEMR